MAALNRALFHLEPFRRRLKMQGQQYRSTELVLTVEPVTQPQPAVKMDDQLW